MKKTILLIILSLFGLSIFAQPNLDSLWAVWNDESRADTCRLKAIDKLARKGYRFSDPDSARNCAQLQYDFAKEKNLRKYMAMSLHAQAATWYDERNFSKAIEYFSLALNIYTDLDLKEKMSDMLYYIGHSYRRANKFISSIEYYNRSLKIREEINDQSGVASVLKSIGLSYYRQGDFLNAISYYNKCLLIEKELNNKKGSAGSLIMIGNIYLFQAQYLKALEIYTENLKIREEIDDQEGVAKALNNIGNIYYSTGDVVKSLDFYNQSLKIREKLDDKKGLAQTLGNIGAVHSKQGEYSKALEYFAQSLNIREQLNDKHGIANCLTNIGYAYQVQGEYSPAIEYSTQSIKILEEIKERYSMPTPMTNIGAIYLAQNNDDKAISWCKKALDISEDVGSIENQRDACSCLYKAYKSKGKGIEALEFHERITMLDDSIKKEGTNKVLQQMEFAKQMFADSLAQEEEKLILQHTHEMEVSKKDKQRNLFLVSGLLVLVIAVSLYSRLRYVRRSRAIIQKERDSSDNLLLNILPAEIAAELKEKGRADARDYDMVTILFTDFKGFTQTSSHLSAQELVSEINICFEAFDKIIGKYGIEKIKTIGDAYMAAGGLPVPTNESVKNTIYAALEMQTFIIERKKEMQAKGQPAFEMRAGIHTGHVVAGIVGVKKFQYDIWGNTVNIASRMESNGDIGKVNISQETYDLLKDEKDIIFEKRGQIEVKGKGMMEMYYVGFAIVD